ncbi:MAG: DUF4386 domain-containing protein [Pleurocapsa minor GSE-CHR-MK-17-07R]|jgi:hypothetical protein|nr:DUF4386 domain-containing protein [Pleurocapsa minor GSE-CHR-MK 17-07R]
MTLFKITGLVLIALPVAFNVLFFMLGKSYEYPAILRKPTDHILSKFLEGGRRLALLWYAFALTALLAAPMALLVYAVFAEQFPLLAVISAIVGVLSGLLQAMGLLRWPLLVPVLARQYQAADATPAQRDAIGVVFNAFHQYVGVVVGEHLGFIFTGAWTILVSIMMFTTPVFGAIMGIFGIISALGVMAGLLEPAGWKPAGAINAISYILWSLWLIAAGILLLVA